MESYETMLEKIENIRNARLAAMENLLVKTKLLIDTHCSSLRFLMGAVKELDARLIALESNGCEKGDSVQGTCHGAGVIE